MNYFGIILIFLFNSKTFAYDEYDGYKKIYKKIVKTTGPTTSFMVNMLWDITNNKSTQELKNNKCYEDIEKFKNGVYNGEGWALRMLDSSAHLQSGFLEGNTANYGNFEECLGVSDSKNDIEGKFCTMNIEVYNTRKRDENVRYSDLYSNTIAALCVPNSCSLEELHRMVKKNRVRSEYKYYLFFDMECITKEDTDVKLDRSQFFIIVFLIMILFLILFGTLYDIFMEDRDEFSKHVTGNFFAIPSAFSIHSNGKNLIKKDEHETSIRCIYGLRFISACGIIIVHRNLTDSQPLTNTFAVDQEITKLYNTAIINAYLFVDVFFLLSGLLVSYTFLNRRTGEKSFNPLSLLLHRYIRLTPPLAVTLLLIFPTSVLCRGLHYRQAISETEYCERNWPYVLLYVSNFFGVDEKCLPHTWYLSADMQLFVSSFILLYMLTKNVNTKYIFVLLWLLITTSISTVFILSYVFQLTSIPIATSEVLTKEDQIVYEPFYTRAGPWLIGFGLGILIKEFNENQYKVNKICSTLCWILATVCIVSASLGMYPFLQYDFTHDHIAEYVYKSVYRSVWAFGFALIIYACHTGHGGFVNKFLSSHIFHPLSKLSYCLYLVHPMVQTLLLESKNYPRQFSAKTQIVIYVGDIFYSLVAALVLHLVIEAPTLSIEKLFKQNKDDEPILQSVSMTRTDVENVD